MHTGHKNKLMKQQVNELSIHLTQVNSPICEKQASKQIHSLYAVVIRKTNNLVYMVYVAQWDIKKIMSIQRCSIVCTVKGNLIKLHIAMKNVYKKKQTYLL